MNILMPSIIDPRYHHGGAGTVTRSLLKILEQYPIEGKVDLVISSDYYQPHFRQFFSLIKSFFSPLPSKALFTYSSPFLREIKHKSMSADLIILNGSDLIWLIPHFPPNIPLLLISHNIEHQLFFSQITSLNLPSPLNRLLFRDYYKLKNYELNGIEQIRNIICLSFADQQFILESQLDQESLNLFVVPPLFDYCVPVVRPLSGRDDINIGFLANLQWWPNVHGLKWFLNNVFPYLKKEIKLHIFGEKNNVCKESERIINHGYVENIQDVWGQVDLMICPIFAGGGVNVKFAEAVYNDKPLLATSFSSRGLPLYPSPSITLLDYPNEWVNFLNAFAPNILREKNLSLRQIFSLESYVDPVADFIFKIL